MIDLKSLNDNLELMNKNIIARGVQANPDLVLSLYQKKKNLITALDALRKQRNTNTEAMKTCLQEDRYTLIDLGKELKTAIATQEQELTVTNQYLSEETKKLPNYSHRNSPQGKGDENNYEIKKVGIPRTFDFEPKSHLQIAEYLNLVDFENASQISGPRFYFLKNETVLLEWALVRYVMNILLEHKFTLYQTPDIVKEEIAQGLGFVPRGAESNIYTLENTGTCLIGTAEIPLGGYYRNQIIDLNHHAILMGGISHCFRREAGSSGLSEKGLYRVHQFTKVEMFILCKPEDSELWHQKLLNIEEEIFTGLELPYRIVDICVGSLGAAAYRKYDIEAWMPAHETGGSYQEITSTSNCTDFQSRRLKIRFKDINGKIQFVHTLNGTAIAVPRILVAILENYQQQDNSLALPKVLYPYLNFKTISKK